MMQTVNQVMTELKKKGSEQTRKIFAKHGAPDNLFGVKVADLKVIAKAIKGNQELALELFETGNGDAQYLAGLVADGSLMTKKQLDDWAKKAEWQMICEYSVPGVATESKHARALAKKWIKSSKETIASAGWNTYAGIMATRDDDELDIDEIRELIQQVLDRIDGARNRVRYTMNGFVIGVGASVKPLLKEAKAAARKLGKVEVDMNGTACKVPLATDYIRKIEDAGRAGKKRKTIKC